MKYLDTMIGFREFPDEISLLINITGCCWHCPGCHSPELWEDIGIELTEEELSKLIESNRGISCVGLMGGDANIIHINKLAEYVKNNYSNLKVGWYSGSDKFSDFINLNNFDYVKIGSYKKELGGLDNPNTNQRLYKIDNSDKLFINLIDITHEFWKKYKN